MEKDLKNIVVTGGCGFIGSHFVEYVLTQYPEIRVINVDALTYAAHPDTPGRLSALGGSRYELIQKSIGDPSLAKDLESRPVDIIVNFAAETHVDRSILDPGIFLQTNVMGVQNLLSICRTRSIRLTHVSTDEVYGSLEPTDLPFLESSPLKPNSPYAASKAAADLIVLASGRTYHQDVVITRCSNNFGPLQFPEKLLPLLIANANDGLQIPVYGDGKQIRDWIYVTDHCIAVDSVMRNGTHGEVYNVSAFGEETNIELIQKVLKMMGKPTTLIKYVGDRPAHDRRYALDSQKIRQQLGWRPEVTFENGLLKTVEWYMSNQLWLNKVRNQDYKKYYAANYDQKFKQPMERVST